MLSSAMVYQGDEPSTVRRSTPGGRCPSARSRRVRSLISILLTFVLTEVALHFAFAVVDKHQCLADGNQWDEARGLCFRYVPAPVQPNAPAPAALAESELRLCRHYRNVLADATEVARECSAACQGQLLASDMASACIDICARRWFCEDRHEPGH